MQINSESLEELDQQLLLLIQSWQETKKALMETAAELEAMEKIIN